MFKKNIKFLSTILCVIFAFSSFGITANGATTSELRSQKDKIQEEIDNAQSKIDELSAEKAETQEYLNAIQEKINLLQDKIDNLESEKATLQAEIDAIQVKIDTTEAEIEATQKEIDAKQAEFDENYELYCQRLRAMYVSGSTSNLETLLTCTDLSSMLTRSQMIKSVSQQDSDQLDALMTKMEEIEASKQELETKRTELKADRDALDADKAELQKSIDDIESTKGEYDAQAAEANELMKKLTSQSSEYMELIETNEAEIAEIEAEIRRVTTSASTGGGSYSGSSGGGSGQLGYPTNSRTVSAGFPYYSSGRWHGGIDFPVSTGSNVYAAGSGTVILVKYLNYSYGYHIVIDHGDGLSTLYAHNSQILVSVGQQVSAGQVIALSGSTGNSTGPHCHFEVRVNGTQVNPYNYL